MREIVCETEVRSIPSNDGDRMGQSGPEKAVLVIEDTPVLSRSVGLLCDYLGIRLEIVSSGTDLTALLCAKRPMAVMASVDTPAQDGCHVLKTVAAYNRDLPVLLVTGRDPAILGAVQAVEEIWQLSHVRTATATDRIGELVEFLSDAGLRDDSFLAA